MLKEIAKTKTGAPLGFVEILYKTNKRYYRIVRARSGDMYQIYLNNSEYGAPEHDEKMYYNGCQVREYTIKECKESIKVYEMIND